VATFIYCAMEIVLPCLVCMISLLNHRQGNKCPKTGQSVPKRDTFAAGKIPFKCGAIVILLMCSCTYRCAHVFERGYSYFHVLVSLLKPLAPMCDFQTAVVVTIHARSSVGCPSYKCMEYRT
jgi:hypothetical protein